MLDGVITKYKSNLQPLLKKHSNLIEINEYDVKSFYLQLFSSQYLSPLISEYLTYFFALSLSSILNV